MIQIFPSKSEVIEKYGKGVNQLIWTNLAADLETPVSAMLKLSENEPYSFLLESVKNGTERGRYSVIGLSPDVIWRTKEQHTEINYNALQNMDEFTVSKEDPLVSLRRLINNSNIDVPENLPPMAAGIFGYIGYDMIRHMEDIPIANPDILGVHDAIMLRPTISAIFDSVKNEFIIVTPIYYKEDVDIDVVYNDAVNRILSVVASFSKTIDHNSYQQNYKVDEIKPESNVSGDDFIGIVEQAKEYIAAGDIFQVVLSQRFSAPFELHPFALYRALRCVNPSPFLYYLNFPDFSVVGASPEILIRSRNNKVTLRPLAGTRPRGKDENEDRLLSEELLADPKERSEHLMLLDLGRNDVGRVAKTGTVNVTKKFSLEYYSQVMHIVSNIEAKLDRAHDQVDIIEAGFPAGTLSGAPKIRAMEIIDELEKERRGIYGGCIGYFSANGNLDTCIVLRTAIVKDGIMHVQAGAGVVADSIPKNEYMECVNKAKALFKAAEVAGKFVNKP